MMNLYIVVLSQLIKYMSL